MQTVFWFASSLRRNIGKANRESSRRQREDREEVPGEREKEREKRRERKGEREKEREKRREKIVQTALTTV